ncbi:MAG: hypothetical protein Q8R78_01590 [Candidatus Omnitrophota bacterium]|nr:hypothetical protein [Candidatus Omnitrophota bacterium]
MGDELDNRALLAHVTPEMLADMIAVMKAVYGKGYINNTSTYADRMAMRAKSYGVLKKLGREK